MANDSRTDKPKKKRKRKKKRLKVFCPSCRFLVTLPAVTCPKCKADMRTGFGGENTQQLSALKLFNFAMRVIFILLFLFLGGREVYLAKTGQEDELFFPKLKEQISYELHNLGRMILAQGPRAREASPPAKPNSMQVLAQEYPLLLRPDILASELSRMVKVKGDSGPELGGCRLPKPDDYAHPSRLSPCQRAILVQHLDFGGRGES